MNNPTEAERLEAEEAASKAVGALSLDEVKRLLFYGAVRNGEEIDKENGVLDWAVTQMFHLLKEHTIFEAEKVEEAFWGRLGAISVNSYYEGYLSALAKQALKK